MAEYAGTWSYVSPTVGQAALALPNVRIMGMPGFGSGPVYGFDAGPHMGMVYYSFGPAPAAATAVESTSTGVTATETSYALYGHVIPLSVFGVGRIGGDIISGPFVQNGLATFCISFGVPADPYGTRTLRQIAFDSEVVWENGAFNTESFTFRFYQGRLDQAVDPVEIAHWDADAIAYRPQILLWFENLPIKNTKFGKIPYIAAVIADGSGDDVNLGEAFERLAYSPWVGYNATQFETVGVTDSLVSGGLIIAQDAEFLSTIQQFTRFYRNWNILQTDKLRIVDRGAAVAPDIVLDKTRLMDKIIFAIGEANSIPRVLELSTIDPDADYTVVPSQAVRPREPVNVSASVSTETVYLPMIMDSFTRQSLVTYTKYQEEIARKKITGTAMMYGLEIEPADLVAITGLGEDFANYTYKVIETLHGANYSVEFTLEAFLNCELSGDPFWASVVLLLGFEDVDGSIGAPGFTDESSRHNGTGNVNNTVSVDTGQFKFGSSSAQFIATSLVFWGSNPDWSLSPSASDQFTVECWARFGVIHSSTQIILGVGTFANPSWYFAVDGGAELTFVFVGGIVGSGGPHTVTTTSGAGIATGNWYHLAVDKDAAGKIRLYVNGIMKGNSTPSDGSITSFSLDLDMGAIGAGSNPMDGWLDELRITKGIARYGSDGGFSLPTNAYPRGAVL